MSQKVAHLPLRCELFFTRSFSSALSRAVHQYQCCPKSTLLAGNEHRFPRLPFGNGASLETMRCVLASICQQELHSGVIPGNAVLYTVTAYTVVNTHISSIASPLALLQAPAIFVTCSRRLAALRSARQQSRSDQACFSLAPLQISLGPGLRTKYQLSPELSLHNAYACVTTLAWRSTQRM